MTLQTDTERQLKPHQIWQDGQTPQPCIIVLFGATGDLAQHKLLPTLAHLMHDHPFPKSFCVVAFGRRPLNDEKWRTMALESLKSSLPAGDRLDEQSQKHFASRLFYCQSNFDDAAGYQRLKQLLEKLDREYGTAGNRIFYLATPPEIDSGIIAQLGAAGLSHPERDSENSSAFARIIIEKPFGHNLATAQELNRDIARVFREDQVFRIDHYLGKETVQNIFASRFTNSVVEPLWNQRYIDHVQITVAESLGIGTRAAFYESEGAIRDIVQNHVMQILSVIAMEPPVALDADDIHDEGVKVLRAIVPLTLEEVRQNVVRGQYTAGQINGQQVRGYQQEQGVKPDSTTETFVALKLFVENWRWETVPFYLRTGKCLPKRATEVTIQYKRVPHLLYRHPATEGLVPNRLTVRIQPDEGISLKIGAKVPGTAHHLKSIDMNFSYREAFGIELPDAYERLIADCMLGDSTLFIHSDGIEASWRIIDSITECWKQLPASTVQPYAAGTWGPSAADELLKRDGRAWYNP